MRKTIVATLIIFAAALLISVLLAAARQTKHPDKNIHAVSASNTSNVIDSTTSSPQITETSSSQFQQEDTAAVTTATEEFRARKILTASTPNFSTPQRRAPIRRKGNVQG